MTMTMMTVVRCFDLRRLVPAQSGGPPGLPSQRAEQEWRHGDGHLQGLPGRRQSVWLQPGRAVNEHSWSFSVSLTLYANWLYYQGSGKPLTFTLGVGKVIKGWDRGLVQTCPGEQVQCSQWRWVAGCLLQGYYIIQQAKHFRQSTLTLGPFLFNSWWKTDLFTCKNHHSSTKLWILEFFWRVGRKK